MHTDRQNVYLCVPVSLAVCLSVCLTVCHLCFSLSLSICLYVYRYVLRPVASTSVNQTTDGFKAFFTGKIDTIRAMTATAPGPTIEHRQVPPLASFNKVTVEEVSQILRKTPYERANLTRYDVACQGSM